MKRGLLALFLLALLPVPIAPASAVATRPMPIAERSALMLRVASAYWGTESTCPAASVQIIWAATMPIDPDTGTVRGAETTLGGCALGPREITLLATSRPPLSVRCTVIAHEYGHLIGLGHDAGGVMDPAFIGGGGTIAPCRELARSLVRRR